MENNKAERKDAHPHLLKKKRRMYVFCGLGAVLITVITGYSQMGVFSLLSKEQKTMEAVENHLVRNNMMGKIPKNNANKTAPAIAKKPVNPFSGPYVLQGVVLNPAGKNVAILQGSNKTFIVAENELLENAWKVERISAKQAVLKLDDREYVLTLPDGIKAEGKQ